MDIRKTLENTEIKFLSPFAALSSSSKGRKKVERDCEIRTCYMKDRDRIVHSKSFRRLKHKTQVFFVPRGDHYRTRLTHTLEVSQISRTIARALQLNEDLTEAIALGHDLGHTPFGHIGEKALTESGKLSAPFKHNKQSLRIVDFLENKGSGLNLTFEVRDGIVNHTGATDPETREGKIVKIADRIAYVNHDIDDAIRAKIIRADELPADSIQLLGDNSSKRINTLVKDMIINGKENNRVELSESIGSALHRLRTFLFNKVYSNSPAKAENEKAIFVINSLFEYYFDNPEEIPDEMRAMETESVSTSVCDFISGMTDRYALDTFYELFLPKSWQD